VAIQAPTNVTLGRLLFNATTSNVARKVKLLGLRCDICIALFAIIPESAVAPHVVNSSHRRLWLVRTRGRCKITRMSVDGPCRIAEPRYLHHRLFSRLR
jgi:hypothetical protein